MLEVLPDQPDRIVNARLLTCVDEKVIDDGTVIFEGDLIAWAGPSEEIPHQFSTVEADNVLDAGGATVMPGLVDGHMHISFGEPRTEEELYIYTPSAYRAIRAAASSERVLLAGVTSACDPGGPTGIAPAVRDATEAGLIQGPRLAAAGRQITTQQGIGDTLPRWVGIDESSFGALVRGRDELLDEIRNQVKDGVDMIKIAGSGPGTTEWGAFRLEELELAVSEAHRLGRPIAMHARSRQSVADAVAAGVDWIMHASYMDTETLETVVEKGIPILPALTLLVNSLEAGGMHPHVRDAIASELDAAVSILSKAHEMGAVLMAGSESGFAMTPYGQWHTREIELFVSHLGMTDSKALLAMTRDAAVSVPGLTERIGTLSPGKYADVLIVDGRPDENVSVLSESARLLAIIKGGKVVRPWRPVDLPARRMPFELARPYTPSPLEREIS